MTPESAMSWFDVLNAGGTVFVLAAIIFYGAKMLPKFLERWGEHTEALIGIKARMDGLEEKIKELCDECKHNSPNS